MKPAHATSMESKTKSRAAHITGVLFRMATRAKSADSHWKNKSRFVIS